VTAARLKPTDMPDWPLWMTREIAAAYVGVSPNVFDAEVKAGMWPDGVRRGLTGGRLTWHKEALDDRSRALAGGRPGPRAPQKQPADKFEEERQRAQKNRLSRNVQAPSPTR
jgi:hypothetical protein